MKTIFLNYHKKLYPNIQSIDKIKLIYQGLLGPMHNAYDLKPETIFNHINQELVNSKKENINENYYEWISEDYIRVNLIPIKNNINYIKELINAFLLSCTIELNPYNKKDSSIENNKINALKEYLSFYLDQEEYQDYDYKPLHHSSIYKSIYNPHYLLIHYSLLSTNMRLTQLSNFISKQKFHSIIALEGKCASGKSTLSNYLKDKYTIIHTDDFFLKSDLKTKERLNEIGGNIDYELLRKALEDIKQAYKENKNKLSIKVFSCSTQTYYYKEIKLLDKVLLEGVYSTHPYIRSLIDKIAYLYINDSKQLERINNRILKDRFINEWIPLENKYYSQINIEAICDIII